VGVVEMLAWSVIVVCGVNELTEWIDLLVTRLRARRQQKP
jgi:hypothetical protein